MIKSFFAYIKNPVSTVGTELFTFKIYFKLILLNYLLVFVSSIGLALFSLTNLLPINQTPRIDSLIPFIVIVLIGPLFEEALFRLNLKISKLNVAVFLATLIVLPIKMLLFQGINLYIYLLTIPLFLLIYYTISLFNFPIKEIDTFVKSKFNYIFPLFTIVFGMLHLSHYETIYWWMLVIIPILTAPFISIGFVLGYVRMKYGFIYGVLMHSTINFIFVFITMPKHWF